MKNNKKKKLLIIALSVMLLIMGATYAWFSYQGEINQSVLIAGNIYLNLDSNNDTISLTNVFPETATNARSKNNNVITFSVQGTNTSNKDIYYQINLLEGTALSGTRFNPDELTFDLSVVENNTETLLLDAVSYDTLNHTKMWVDKIPAGTNSSITKQYKLRMWVSQKVIVSDSYEGRFYTPSEYHNRYASVKFEVVGGMEQIDFPLTFEFNEDTFSIELNDEVETNDTDDIRVSISTANNEIDFNYIDSIQNGYTQSNVKSANLAYNFSDGMSVTSTLVMNDIEEYGTDMIFEVTRNGQVVQSFIRSVYNEIIIGYKDLYIAASEFSDADDGMLIYSPLRNKITSNESDEYNLVITSSAGHIFFNYENELGQDVTETSLDMDYELPVDNQEDILFVLTTDNDTDTDTVLTFTLEKNGEVIQVLTLPVTVPAPRLDLSASLDANTIEYTGESVSDSNVIIEDENHNPYVGEDDEYTYYSGSGCSGTELERDEVVNVGSYSVRVMVPSNEDYTALSTCLPFSIVKADTEIAFTSLGGTYNKSAIPAEAEGTTGAVISYYTNNTCTTSFSGTPTNAGTYYAIATDPGDSNHNSSSTACTAHVIAPKSINDSTISKSYTYSNNTLTVVIKDGSTTLTKNTDYTYTSSTASNKVTINLTGINNYTGTSKATIDATKTNVAIPSSPANKTYKAAAYSHGISVPSGASIVSSSSTTSATNVGTYKVVLKLNDTSTHQWSDGTTSNKTITWKIVPKSISTATVSGLSNKQYTGKAITQAPTVKITINGSTKTLKNNTDYTYTTKNNTKVGTATITITGKGNYTGTKKATFKICDWKKSGTTSGLTSCTKKSKPSSPKENATYVTCETYVYSYRFVGSCSKNQNGMPVGIGSVCAPEDPDTRAQALSYCNSRLSDCVSGKSCSVYPCKGDVWRKTTYKYVCS